MLTYDSAINNPNVSEDAKAKAEDRLKGIQYGEEGDKDPKHVAAGLKG